MLPYFAARGLMPIEMYDARIAAAEETFATKSVMLDEERARLAHIERLWVEATEQARLANERAERAEEIAQSAPQTIASLEAALREQRTRGDEAEAGNLNKTEFDARSKDYLEIARARIGHETKVTTKREELAA
jgi:hypothetical protein